MLRNFCKSNHFFEDRNILLKFTELLIVPQFSTITHYICTNKKIFSHEKDIRT